MGIIVLFFLVAAGMYFLIVHYDKKFSALDILISLIPASFIAIAVLLSLVSLDLSDETVGYETTPIASLSARNDVNGQFILGCGTVDKTPYYYYYKIVRNSSYQLDKTPAMEAVVLERDEPPCLRYARKRCSGFLRFMIGGEYISTYPEIVIPTGSIIKDFNPNF
jgi:hypothetical protein